MTLSRYLVFGLILELFCASSVYAQHQIIPRDTSYTLHSAYQKYIIKYPNIVPVKSEITTEIWSDLDVVYHTIGQRELHADIYCPKNSNSRKLPIVLLIHGGGWSTGDKSLLTPLAIQLASSGFIAMNLEYRLSPEALYPEAVFDINYAIAYVKKAGEKYNIDKNKIAVLGSSAGAQLASLIGTTGNSDIFNIGQDTHVQAIINIDGILAFIHPDSREGEAASKWLGGAADKIPDIWKEASALTYVNNHTPPTLFVNSSFPRFHAGRDDYIAVLDKNNIYSEVHTLADSPHSFWLFHPWFEPTVEYVVSFLNKVFPVQGE